MKDVVNDKLTSLLNSKVNQDCKKHVDSFVQQYGKYFEYIDCIDPMDEHDLYRGSWCGYGSCQERKQSRPPRDFCRSQLRFKADGESQVRFIAQLLSDAILPVYIRHGASLDALQPEKKKLQGIGSKSIEDQANKLTNEINQKRAETSNQEAKIEVINKSISNVTTKLGKMTELKEQQIPAMLKMYTTNLEQSYEKKIEGDVSEPVKVVREHVFTKMHNAAQNCLGCAFPDASSATLAQKIVTGLESAVKGAVEKQYEFVDMKWTKIQTLKPSVPDQQNLCDPVSPSSALYQDKEMTESVIKAFGALGHAIHNAKEAMSRTKAAEFWAQTTNHGDDLIKGKQRKALPPARVLKAQCACKMMATLTEKWQTLAQLFDEETNAVVKQYNEFQDVRSACDYMDK